MSSDDIAISVQHISKRYDLFGKPSDQLKQFVLPRLQRLAGIKKKNYFQEFWALSDVSFEVKKGESFGIVGRNGSGKSTLLQIITGTLTPTTGTVSTRGRIAALLELGSGFNPDFTGRENVYLNAALLGFSREQIEERFDAIAAFADIGQHLDQPVKSYSSGMIVRLAIAVQTQVDPDILIVDEALAVGDALFQKRCYRQIDRLLDNGCTLLFVSHDQEIVRSLTTRALFLHQGMPRNYGSSAEVLFSYREFLQQEEEAAFRSLQQNTEVKKSASRSDSSYGNLDVEILSVKIFDANDAAQAVLYAGDTMRLSIECVSHCDIENLNVAFRIRTKEGIKVTTWGTLNQDMPHFTTAPESTFWHRKFTKGEAFTVDFVGTCSLAANLYEIQAVVAVEYDQYYANQRILHWLDEAAHLTVVQKSREYVFDGVCDLGLRYVENASSNAIHGVSQ
ncbi:MAG: ABC transporter ATP-binding protein [Pseudomonadota bacterium]